MTPPRSTADCVHNAMLNAIEIAKQICTNVDGDPGAVCRAAAEMPAESWGWILVKSARIWRH